MKLQIVAGIVVLAAASVVGGLYGAETTAAGGCCGSGTCPMMAKSNAPVVLLDVATTAPATQPAVDVGNTKCIVMGDAIEGAGATLAYEGKIYHFCCKDCIPTFQKDSAKYIGDLEKDPAKFGVKK